MKKGPMTEEDWSRHTNWLEKNAARLPRNSKIHYNCFKKRSSIKYVRESKKIPINILLKRLKGLSKPRIITEKRNFDESSEIPRVKRSALKFRTTKRLISLSVPRMITEKYISRPRPPSPLPQKKWFVPRRALLYKITTKTNKLAQPRNVRSYSLDDDDLKSKPMTKEEWRRHKEWLVERANAKSILKPKNPNLFRDHRPIEELLPRLQTLAYPRIHVLEKPKENRITKSALNAQASPLIIKLATPKLDFTILENQIKIHEKCRKGEEPIKSSSPIINKGKKTIN